MSERPEWKVVNVDSLTYAANPNTIKEELNNPNYKFYKTDIRDTTLLGAYHKSNGENMVPFYIFYLKEFWD